MPVGAVGEGRAVLVVDQDRALLDDVRVKVLIEKGKNSSSQIIDEIIIFGHLRMNVVVGFERH